MKKIKKFFKKVFTKVVKSSIIIIRKGETKMDKLLQELINTRINDIKKIKQILKEIKEVTNEN